MPHCELYIWAKEGTTEARSTHRLRPQLEWVQLGVQLSLGARGAQASTLMLCLSVLASCLGKTFRLFRLFTVVHVGCLPSLLSLLRVACCS